MVRNARGPALSAVAVVAALAACGDVLVGPEDGLEPTRAIGAAGSIERAAPPTERPANQPHPADGLAELAVEGYGSGTGGPADLGLPVADRECPANPGGLINERFRIRVRTVAIRDRQRGRDVPVDVYVPVAGGDAPPVFGNGPYPVVVFSHGAFPLDRTLFTSVDDPIFPQFTEYWASKGYVVLAPRHRKFPPQVWSQEDRTRDVSFALDHARELVQSVDRAAFLDLDHPVVAGFSKGAATAVLVAGTRLPGVDLVDGRFGAAMLLTGATSEIEGNTFWRPSWSGLEIPVMAIVGSEDLNNEPGTTPDDFLDVVRESPPGGKHGVMVMGAGHHLGARSWEPAGTLEASRTATTLFLRGYADPPMEPAVATLSNGSFCKLVRSSLVRVEHYERPILAASAAGG